MPITIEEVSAEVTPEERSASAGRKARDESRPPSELDNKVRALLIRERRRAERLSDR
jgi:hypothetical protein